MRMPTQKPGSSKQDYQTPPEFLAAVRRRLGIYGFIHDLAASSENAVCSSFSDEDTNALTQDWTTFRMIDDSHCWCWLNPPYADISPWVQKCAEESAKGAHIACLVPASTGANWFKSYVYNKAYTIFLNGRITFVGASGPYPKDCMLLLYTPYIRGGFDVWTWNK